MAVRLLVNSALAIDGAFPNYRLLATLLKSLAESSANLPFEIQGCFVDKQRLGYFYFEESRQEDRRRCHAQAHRSSRGRWYFAVRSETYLGFLVPGMVMTLVGALSSPAAIASRMRAQNASSIAK